MAKYVLSNIIKRSSLFGDGKMCTVKYNQEIISIWYLVMAKYVLSNMIKRSSLLGNLVMVKYVLSDMIKRSTLLGNLFDDILPVHSTYDCN